MTFSGGCDERRDLGSWVIVKTCGVRRETGKEWVVQVHRDEDVASRIGPESCVGSREGAGEALTGERAGQP